MPLTLEQLRNQIAARRTELPGAQRCVLCSVNCRKPSLEIAKPMRGMFVAIVTFKPLGMNWIIIRFSCREVLTGLNPLYTYFLGREEIKAYDNEFTQRLLVFGEQYPYI